MAEGLGSYAEAMRAFAQCADAEVEAPGYCHGSLATAAQLSNHAVCTNGATTDVRGRDFLSAWPRLPSR